MNDKRVEQTILFYDDMKEKFNFNPSVAQMYKEKAEALRELLVYRNAWANIREKIENKSQAAYDFEVQITYEDCLAIIDNSLMHAHLYEIGKGED